MKTVEAHRLRLEAEYQQLSQSIEDDSEQRAWVDWVKEFGNLIDKLTSTSLYIADRKRFLQGVVEQITVKEKNLREHELEIEFRLPYVGDDFEWIDPTQKSKGYRVYEGQSSMKLAENLLKK